MIDLSSDIEIRALSWWQPFGTAMLYGKTETRVWSTKYRGWVLICTTKKNFWKQPLDKTRSILFKTNHTVMLMTVEQNESRMEYPTHELDGFAIGLGLLSECRETKTDDHTYYAHSDNVFAHVYTNVLRIRPFEFKGTQKWGEVDQQTRSKIVLLN